MELQEFIDMLYAAGWKAPNDAQHEHTKKVYAEIAALKDSLLKFMDKTYEYSAYCGFTVEIDDAGATKIGEHIASCEKYPMRKLEAANAKYKSELEKMAHYAECALAQFKDGNGHLDITGFNHLIKESQEALKED